MPESQPPGIILKFTVTGADQGVGSEPILPLWQKFQTGENQIMSKTMMGAALLCAVLVGGVSEASAQSGTKVGVLSCKLAPSVGLIVGSRQRMSCSFTPNKGGRVERYSGTMGRIGLDIGVSAGGALAWAVFAPTEGIQRGALAGRYAGASGDIALGLGVGANALIGGSKKSIALRPLTVEGSTGVGVALGAAGLTLTAVR